MKPAEVAVQRGTGISAAISVLLSVLGLLSVLLTGCSTKITSLTLRQPIRQDLTTNDTHQYRLSLRQEQYARLILEPRRIRITGSLYDARNNLVSEFICADFEPISFSAIAAKEGDFRLEIRSLESDGTGGSYLVKLDELHSATESDRARVAAEQADMAAEKLRVQWDAAASRQAIEKYAEAIRHWEDAKETGRGAASLRKIGEVKYSLGDTEEAKEKFEAAYQMSKVNKDELGQAQALLDLSELNLELVAYNEAAEQARRAEEIGLKLQNRKIVAMTRAALGESKVASDPQSAIPLLEQAKDYWDEVGDRKQLARLYQKIGQVYYFCGEFKKALDAYQQTLHLARALELRGEEISALNLLSLTYSVIGEKQQALKYYAEAKSLAEGTGNRLIKARLMGGMAFVYEELGEKAKALPLREESLAIFESMKAHSTIASAHLCLGELRLSLAQHQLARESIEQALQIYRLLQNRMMEPIAIRDLGLIYEAQGDWQQSFSQLQRALALYQPGTQERWKAYLLLDIGRLLQRLGKALEAEAYFSQALEQNRKVEDKIGESQSLYHLARLYRDKGDWHAAVAPTEKAIALIESLRAKVFSQGLRTSYSASVNQIYELYIDVLMQQQQERSSANFAAEALAISERARARSLLDLLNDSRHEIKRGADPKLFAQERTLLQTLNGKAERKMQLAGGKEKEQELTTLNKELESLNSQIEEVRAQMRETSPRYAALTQPQLLKAEEIQQLLDDNTMLLEFALGEKRSYLWAVTRDSLEAFTLPRRAIIEKLSNDVYALLTAPQKREGETLPQLLLRIKQAHQQYWPKAAELSQMLLTPVAERMGNKRLIVVGEGALQRIPFSALPAPKDEGGRLKDGRKDEGGGRKDEKNKLHPSSFIPHPLVVDHEIINLPSASILAVLRQEQARRREAATHQASFLDSLRAWLGKGQSNYAGKLDSIAILADPVFEKEDIRIRVGQQAHAAPSQPQTRDVDLSDENLKLNRLPETAVEAGAIEKAAGANAFLLKKDFAVNRALLESDELNRYGIIHFATHGFWDSEHPELSGIVLSRYDQQGNKQDGFLRLSDIYNLRLPKELVVLSACETALGKDIRGEGLMALTRGFMYAGASRVMASLWKVEESATVELMKVFYEKLLREKLTPAAALREAQVAMWRIEPTSVPYEWAAFVLQGEYR